MLSVFVPRGKRQTKHTGANLCIIMEQLVKISHSEEKNRSWIGFLELMELVHHAPFCH